MVVSPVSVFTLLAILQQGAMGNTLTQLTQALRSEPEVTRAINAKLTRNLKV
jgi:serine protease inhibitor